jgi:hypothetical protein
MDIFIWPGVVLILGIFLIVICRAAFVRLLDRIEKIDKLGVSAPLQEVKKDIKQGEPIDIKSLTLDAKPSLSEGRLLDSKSLMEIPYNETIRAQEETFRKFMQTVKFDTSQDREAYLVRVVARTVVGQYFDRCAYQIFGSQLQLLITANTSPLSEELVRRAFQDAKAADPKYHENTTYASYTGFLLNNNLVSHEGDKWKITVCGKEFMKYLVENGLTHVRRG